MLLLFLLFFLPINATVIFMVLFLTGLEKITFAVWEAGVSRHHGLPIEGLLKPLNTIVLCDEPEGFWEGVLNWAPTISPVI